MRSRRHFSRIRGLTVPTPAVRLAVRPPLAFRGVKAAVFGVRRGDLPLTSRPFAPMLTGDRHGTIAPPGADQGLRILGVQHRHNVLGGHERHPARLLELHEQRMDLLGGVPVRLPSRPQPPVPRGATRLRHFRPKAPAVWITARIPPPLPTHEGEGVTALLLLICGRAASQFGRGIAPSADDGPKPAVDSCWVMSLSAFPRFREPPYNHSEV
jgi:hypothetical protein